MVPWFHPIVVAWQDKGFDKDHGLAGSHPKSADECLIFECLASLLIDACSSLGRVVNQIVGVQPLRRVGKDNCYCF
jgi:hypothetical protein